MKMFKDMIYEVIYEGTGTAEGIGRATEELKELEQSEGEMQRAIIEKMVGQL